MNKIIIIRILVGSLIASVAANVFLFNRFIWFPESHQNLENEYVQYRPVFFNLRKKLAIESQYIVDTSQMDDNHIKNMMFVLKYYSKDFKLNEKKLLIERVLWEDKDYMANLTKKANDENWLLNKRQDK